MKRFHIDAVKAAIDELFSEPIPKLQLTENDILISKSLCIDEIEYKQVRFRFAKTEEIFKGYYHTKEL